MIIKGTNRFVIVYGRWVIKIPIIMLLKSARRYQKLLVKVGFVKSLKFFSYGINAFHGFQYNIFKGIVDNWSEYRFFKKTNIKILLPCVFSFFGIFNLCYFASPLNEENEKKDFAYFFYQIMGNDFYFDSHHFSNVNNFGIYQGKICILDYGDKATQKLLLEYGDEISKAFRWSN